LTHYLKKTKCRVIPGTLYAGIESGGGAKAGGGEKKIDDRGLHFEKGGARTDSTNRVVSTFVTKLKNLRKRGKEINSHSRRSRVFKNRNGFVKRVHRGEGKERGALLSFGENV